MERFTFSLGNYNCYGVNVVDSNTDVSHEYNLADRASSTIVGVGKRGEHPFGTALRFTGPVPADSRQ